MNPIVLVGLGVGAYLVYVSTQPGVGGFSSLVNGLLGSAGLPGGAPGGLTDAQRAALSSGFRPHLTGAQAAGQGAAAGAPFAVATFGIAPAVGALIGWFAVHQSNDTREDREEFAKRLGFFQLGGELDGTGRDSLYNYLNAIGRPDLTNYGLNVIGRHAFDQNQRWFADVLAALEAARFDFSKVVIG